MGIVVLYCMRRNVFLPSQSCLIQMVCVLSRLASISHRYSYIHTSTANVKLAVDTCWCVTLSTSVKHKDVAME